MKEEALKLADDLKCILQLPLVEQHQTLYHAEAMIRRLVEELDKQGEPYVWHMKSNDPDSVKDYWYFIDKPSRESKISHQAIPLYTAPQTKPLSDDEILKLWNVDCTNVLASYLIEFARAIEERHGIK